jgi:hypothetical protein
MASIDPTRTRALRARFRADAQMRLRKLVRLTREIVVNQDVLGFGKAHKMFQVQALSDLDRLKVFTDWFTATAYSIVVSDAEWTKRHLQAAYVHGLSAGAKMVGLTSPVESFNETFYQLARIELEGIVDATIQRASRILAYAILQRLKPAASMRNVMVAFTKVAEPRLDLFANHFTVALHNEGRLDAFRAAGAKKVGVDPEAHPKTTTLDALFSGPGSRIPRGRTPSSSTIGRIFGVKQKNEEIGAGQVDIETAGDDDVCPECEAIADDGPYDIDTASGLIPAHPRWRGQRR